MMVAFSLIAVATAKQSAYDMGYRALIFAAWITSCRVFLTLVMGKAGKMTVKRYSTFSKPHFLQGYKMFHQW